VSRPENRYCLDANVLINAWNQYYNKDFCSDYWKELSRLGHADQIFLPEYVRDEIARSDDGLADWIKGSGIAVFPVDGTITEIVRRIFAHDARHRLLVDSTRQRSMADPWVIAHAIAEKAIVVTKENKETQSAAKVKIPNV
jgi:predicted nucleic acid-binding protein